MLVFSRLFRMSPRPDHSFRPIVESLDDRDVPSAVAPTPPTACAPVCQAPAIPCSPAPILCLTLPSAIGLGVSANLSGIVSIGGSDRIVSPTPPDCPLDLISQTTSLLGQVASDVHSLTGSTSLLGQVASDVNAVAGSTSLVGQVATGVNALGGTASLVGQVASDVNAGSGTTSLLGQAASDVNAVGGVVTGVLGSVTGDSAFSPLAL